VSFRLRLHDGLRQSGARFARVGDGLSEDRPFRVGVSGGVVHAAINLLVMI